MAAPIPPGPPAPTPSEPAQGAKERKADDEDLDELDDMLDEFATTAISNNPATSGPGRPQTAPAVPLPSQSDFLSSTNSSDPLASTAVRPTPSADNGSSVPGGEAELAEDPAAKDFAEQLQKEMASLLGEIDTNPQMQKQLNDLLSQAQKEATDNSSIKSDQPATAAGESKDFQSTIRQTMERLQASGADASAATKAEQKDGGAGGIEADLLAQMMKEFGNGAGGAGEGAGNEEDFSKMLLGMMEELTSKEILYEPMKELHDKFPPWMEAHASTTAETDLARYRTQQLLVGEIVARFERPGYADESVPDREFIVDRMQKMQAAGSPPADLVGDMKEASEIFGGLDDACAPQ